MSAALHAPVRTSCPAAVPLQCGTTVDDCLAPLTDPNNCGACGSVCGAGLICFEGVCDCPSGDCGEREPEPEPNQEQVVVLPTTGSGGGATGSDGSGWAPVAVVAAAAAGAASVRRWIPGARKS